MLAPCGRYQDIIHLLQNPKLPRTSMGFNNRKLSHKTLKDRALGKQQYQMGSISWSISVQSNVVNSSTVPPLSPNLATLRPPNLSPSTYRVAVRLTHRTPLHSTPLHSTPLHSTPTHSTPLHSTSLHSASLCLTPLHSTPPLCGPHSTPLH